MQSFAEATPLFYQGHIPIVAYFVIEGEVNLLKNKKPKSIVSPLEVIGVRELLTATPSTVSGEAAPNSTICYLDRSTILAILKEDYSALSEYFRNLLNN